MKIHISNFGPIREFDIDLKTSFNLFVGRNNIGKSYAITVVYLLVKNIIESSPSRAFGVNRYGIGHPFFDFDEIFEDQGLLKNIPTITNLAESLKEKETIDITKYAIEDIKDIIEKILLPSLANSFSNTFSSLDNLTNRYSNEEPTIRIETKEHSLEIACRNGKFNLKTLTVNKEFQLKKIKQSRVIHDAGSRTTIYCCDSKKHELTPSYINMVAFKHAFGFFNSFNREIQSVHYLPASRSGLYQALSAFGQIIAELSKNRSFLSKKIELPGISEPVSDYFIRLSDIRVSKRNYEDKLVNEIAKEIEEEILKGKVDFNPQTKQLMFYPKGTNLKLELSSTSSMVSELAPIVSYLRYVLTQNIKNSSRSRTKKASHLIMIEEPEAHLHPEIQIKLTEIFSKLINADVKLIITSHSNFIFNKVNNLIMANELDINSVSAGVFRQTSNGSILCHLDANELGIEDDNFTRATTELFDEKIKIINELNNREDSDEAESL